MVEVGGSIGVEGESGGWRRGLNAGAPRGGGAVAGDDRRGEVDSVGFVAGFGRTLPLEVWVGIQKVGSFWLL